MTPTGNRPAAGSIASRSVAPRLAVTVAVVSLAALSAAAQSVPTFTKEVAPIIFGHCASCHRPGEMGPFSLLTYQDVKARAEVINRVVQRNVMPPWKPEPGYGDAFIGARRLNDRQITTIRQWVEHGAREGDPSDLPPPPTFTEGWRLGQPDLVIRMPEPYLIPGDGPDVLHNFVVPIPVQETRYLAGLEFRPGNTRVVHHANFRLDRTSSSRRLDEADPGPGYTGPTSPTAQFPEGHFLGWTPGQLPPLLHDGMAWRLDTDTDLVVQLHLQTSGAPELIQPSIGLFFTDEPPARTPMMLRLGEQNIDIPAGTRNYVIEDSYMLPVDVEVYSVQPHAHFRAKEIKGFATLPDGTTRWLIYIKDWDFNWQDVYRYAQPFWLPTGTTLRMQYTYDNTTDNPRNPDPSSRRVRWGQTSTDEMGDLWLQVLLRTDADRQTLLDEFRPKILAEDAQGYEKMLEVDPDNTGLHDGVALIYSWLGETERAVDHYGESVRVTPDSAMAHYNLATALADQGRLDDAVERFRHALRLSPDYAPAHNNLGAVLRIQQKVDEAIAHLRRALELDPENADAHYNLGSAFIAQDRLDEGIRHYRDAVRITPDLGDAHYSLGRALAAQRRPDEAIAQYRLSLHTNPDWVAPMTDLAWALATSPDADIREPIDAVRLAERAAVLTDRRNVRVLDTLAAAYAAAGRFAEAVATEEVALGLAEAAGADAVAPHLRMRLELYRRDTQFRDPTQAATR